ncbi:MAG TPA: hypothetical protein VKA46_23760 [Gemmataceae bacterium]|nr:hypothetical protein [Gemmataceae bacterium]
MPRIPQRAGWWRFPAPSLLIFILLIGIFPWVEIGCEGKPEDFKQLNEKKPSRKIGENGKFVMATQNGYQAIWAGSSPGSDLREVQKEMEEEAKKMAAPPPQQGGRPAKDDKKATKNPDEPDAAPLLAVYFFLVLAAVVVGYAMPPGRWRSITFLSTAGLAILIFGIQVAIGLPVKKKADDKPGNAAKMQGFGDFKMEVQNNGPKPYCRYTLWYYLNWPFLLLPLGLVGVEEVLGLVAGEGKKQKRKRRFEDEEEEDRPRRPRPRDDEDDDEDETPRNKRRSSDDEDEEEEERPRKRSRAAEDDDDEGIQETPRKKRRHHDEDEDDEDDEEEERPRKRRR